MNRFRHVLLQALLLALAAGPSVAQANTPPESGSLYSFEGTLNLSDLKTAKGATVSINQVKDTGRRAIQVDFSKAEGKAYPTVYFPVPTNGWDLTGYRGIQVEIANTSDRQVSVYLRADNEGDWTASPWSVQVIRLAAGETGVLRTEFGRSFGATAFALDPSHITAVQIISDPPGSPFSVLLSDLKAYKSPATTSTQAAQSPAAKGTEAPVRPYVTTTVSPKNHALPYGQDWELVKDWTFGRNRADATVHNRQELDQDFAYRYIYDGGKLDTLPTYWTVHRDYPEDDARCLHVFGDDNLTLKARIAEGGGLRKNGIESGMLRAKFPITPGMYVEMRAKLTKGIGAWPAFWLGAGVEYPDGKFSELPWPPEIDILEFFNWQGRSETRFLSSNIQVNKHPEKFGKPSTIFTTYNKAGEYAPGMDFSEDFHVFALDWQENRPIWILDGHPVKQDYYEWNGPPAHLLITNQLGIAFGDMKDMKADESNWNYVIDYVRVWKKKDL